MENTPVLMLKAIVRRFAAWPLWVKTLSALWALAFVSGLLGLNPYYQPYYWKLNKMETPTEFETHCFGRYLIDLPKGVKETPGIWGLGRLFFGNSDTWKDVNITVKKEDYTPEEFTAELKRYTDELRNTPNDYDKKPSLLKLERIGEKAFLVRLLKDGAGHSMRSEIHQLVGKRYAVLDEDSYPPEGMSFEQRVYVNRDPTTAEARLKKLSAGLYPVVEPSASPAGFCYGGVVFSNTGAFNESATFEFNGTDDSPLDRLQFAISYYAVLSAEGAKDEGDNVFHRLNDVPLEVRARIDTLRKTERPIAGMQAREFLTRWNGEETEHMFRAQRYSDKETTLETPTFEVSMTASPTMFTDAQAIEVWDKVIKSIRPRPGANVASKEPRYGCKIGEKCPISGTWELTIATSKDEYRAKALAEQYPKAQFSEGQVMALPVKFAEYKDAFWRLISQSKG